jgi:hypothetical protein
MPRLSLYRPEKGNDYKFIDRTISEMFQVGGTELYIHKYLGPKNPTEENATADQPFYEELKETNIQDLLFLENRDRTYDSSIYRIRGVYNVQDIDFNLSQFGIFIDNDTVYMTVHINDYIRTIGRKPLSGDVVEVPHLKDEFALNTFDVALPRYFVISDVGRAAEGFSPTWYPHLYRLKLTKINNQQQYKDIFDQEIDENGNTLADVLSTINRDLEINDRLLMQAEADAPKSGYETQHFYTLAVDDEGNAALETADATDIDASNDTAFASAFNATPKRPGYTGYLLGDGVAENGAPFGHGINFPNNPIQGDYFLRTDFLPNRLFRYDGQRWVKREDSVRTNLTNYDPTKPETSTNRPRNTLKTSFIENSNRTGIKFIKSDFILPQNPTSFIETDIDYVSTMYATFSTDRLLTTPIRVEDNGLGKARLVFSEVLNVNERVEWKLYRDSIDQRVAISKALKPRADV